MSTVLLMPSVAANATTAVVHEWALHEGEAFSEGDCIATIETEKAVVEIAAESSGVIGKLLALEGQELEVGAPIAVLLDEGQGQQEIEKLMSTLSTDDKRQEQAVKSSVSDSANSGVVTGQNENENGRIFASPLARRLAEQNSLDLSTLQGCGPHGRIVKVDVERALGSGQAGGAKSSGHSAPKVLPSDRSVQMDAAASAYRAVPHNSMRKAIARRLCESKATIPHYYLTQTFHVGRLMALRDDINAQQAHEGKFSVNDFIIRAVAVSLRDVPQANVCWTDSAMHYFEHADIGVAVSTGTGLITPIVRAADTKPISVISSEICDLIARARDNALKPEEYQGGSFGISNLGMYGIESFSAIVNPPQSAILAVGAVSRTPVVDDGQVVAAATMRATLSVDHRAIDGAVAAQWMQCLKHYLEHPLTMLL